MNKQEDVAEMDDYNVRVELIAVRQRVEALTAALDAACRSLLCLSTAGRRDSNLRGMINVRGYAANRADVAKRALEGDR